MGFVGLLMTLAGAGLMVWAGLNGSKYDNYLMVIALILLVTGLTVGLFGMFT
jgi:hypothetical protein